MSASLATAFAGAGFVRSLVGSIFAQNTRRIIWPLQDAQGAPITDQAGQPQASSLDNYVAILEEHRDELEITRHPVEQGSVISDHAFKLPAHLTLELGWSASRAATSGLPSVAGVLPVPSAAGFLGLGDNTLLQQTYNQLLSLQAQRALLTVLTGKRSYQNLLIKSLVTRTTEKTENALVVIAELEQIIITNVTAVTVPTNPQAQADPQTTTPSVPQGSQALQPATSFNADAVAGT